MVASQSILAQELLVRISRLAGPVEVRKAGAQKWARAEVGAILKSGDSLRTLKGGKVQLVFPGDTVVLIKENSVLNLKALSGGGGGKVKTLVGGFLFDLRKALSPGASFEVETPSALAVVRGTKFGDDVGLDGTTVFTAYEDSVEVSAQGVTRTLEEGNELEVRPGEPPGEPTPTEQTWPEDIFTAEDVALPTAEQYIADLTDLRDELIRLRDTTRRFYEEFARYELEGDSARMSSIYYNLERYREDFQESHELYSNEESVLSRDAQFSWVVTGGSPTPGTEEAGQRISALSQEIEGLFAETQGYFDYIDTRVQAFLVSKEDLLDLQRGTIESRDPERDIRYGTLDTDNDGVPDTVESFLGVEPGSEEPIIQLVSPADGASFSYPGDDSITFEFSVANDRYFKNFELIITAGGVTATRSFVGNTMEISIPDLVQGPPSFAQLFADGGSVEFSWRVRGEFDFETFQQSGMTPSQETSSTSRSTSSIWIESETRTFTLSYLVSGVVDLSLDVVGVEPVVVGDLVTIRLSFSEVTNLHSWAIAITYDPTLVEFDSGRKGSLSGASTVFFGDDSRGVVTISGQIARDSSPISGSGPFAELVFRTRDVGTAVFDFAEVDLQGVGGQAIPTGSLDGTSVGIVAQ